MFPDPQGKMVRIPIAHSYEQCRKNGRHLGRRQPCLVQRALQRQYLPIAREVHALYRTFNPGAVMLRALNRDVERVFNPDRKDHHWGKRKLRREE
jgi:hypothetical protein